MHHIHKTQKNVCVINQVIADPLAVLNRSIAHDLRLHLHFFTLVISPLL